MSGPVDTWRQAAAKWSEVYGQVTDSQWDRPTPCQEWTVRQLVDHTLSWQAEGGRLLGAGTAPGDNWDRIRAAFDALLSDSSQLTGSVPEFGGIPKQELAGFLIGDLLDLNPQWCPRADLNPMPVKSPRYEDFMQ